MNPSKGAIKVVMARLNLIGKLFGSLLIRFLTIIPLLIFFIGSISTMAWADTVLVKSEPVKRGSVTPGLENVVMQKLTLKASSGSANLLAIKLSEYGTSNATLALSSVKFYKEKNGVGDIQFNTNPDELATTTPSKFNAEETIFSFESSQTITTAPVVFYVVYSVSQSASTTGTPTIGSRLIDQSYLMIDKSGVNTDDVVQDFSNFQSREISIVRSPHATDSSPSPFSLTTNLCQTCHIVHLTPDFGADFGLTGSNSTRRLLAQPYFENPGVVNIYPADTFNALCFSCHDGTGASTDIKSQYNTTDPTVMHEGHETTSTGGHTSGYKPPPSGQQYDARIKMPCMICHDIHSSEKGNHAMLADDLYDYALDNNWVELIPNGRIDDGDESCLVCHRRSTELTRTSIVFGISLLMPVSHDLYENCVVCHGGPHALTTEDTGT